MHVKKCNFEGYLIYASECRSSVITSTYFVGRQRQISAKPPPYSKPISRSTCGYDADSDSDSDWMEKCIDYATSEEEIKKKRKG